jgi:hypothetical protein
MRNKLAVAALLAGVLAAQDRPDTRSLLKIDLPKDSPVTLVSADWDGSRTTARGSAMVIDLHTALSLRNSGSGRIRGVTLQVVAQEVTPGGKASVAVPTLDVAPGETFPVRIDLRLLRPLLIGGGPLVQVSLDGVLFEDLSFFGPNRLNSRRSMTVWEIEARRDRKYFKSVLEARGEEALQRTVLESMARQAERPRLDVQVVRGGRGTAVDPGREVQFAFLRFPDAPVEPVEGLARIAGNEAREPSLQVRNRSNRTVRYVEVGWLIQDGQGREFPAGAVPASDPNLKLAPGETGRALDAVSLKFSSAPGRPLAISGLTGYVSHVEFEDGSMWVPSRAALSDPRMARALTASPEEQRLVELYRKRGLAALVNELKKF